MLVEAEAGRMRPQAKTTSDTEPEEAGRTLPFRLQAARP